MTRVLVTGAGAVLGQGIIKSLKGSDLDVEIAAADPNPLSAGLYWVDRNYLVPPAADARYLDRVEEVLAHERPDIVLVGTDVELQVFAEHRQDLESRHQTHILVSRPEAVAIADDKFRTCEFLEEVGFNPPQTVLANDTAAVERLINAVGFPLIVKPRVGARSVGVSSVANRDELRRATSDRSGLIVQECAGPDEAEFTSSALVFDGRAQATIVMRRDLRDGNTHRAFVEAYPLLNRFVATAAEALQPYGPVNFQFRVDASGLTRVFEINCRFSGATPLRALAGFNEVEMCIRRVLFGEPIEAPKQLRTGVIVRHLSETFVTPEQLTALSASPAS